MLFLLAHRTPIAMWTLDAGDTRHGEYADREHVLAHLRGDRGGVLLMHDFDRDDPGVDEKILAVLHSVLAQSRLQPFSFTSLDRIIA